MTILNDLFGNAPGIVTHVITLEFKGETHADALQSAADYYRDHPITGRGYVIATSLTVDPDTGKVVLVIATEYDAAPPMCGRCGARRPEQVEPTNYEQAARESIGQSEGHGRDSTVPGETACHGWHVGGG